MLQKLHISHFRNIHSLELNCSPECHFFTGENGSGKTSLLEALYFLGLARSFRTAELDNLVTHTQSSLRVLATNPSQQNFGVEKDLAKRSRIRIDYQTASVPELAHFLPLVLINTQSLDILNQGPVARRQLMDWGVFHVEPLFQTVWKSFDIALKQRNAALKLKRPAHECRAWDTEIVRFAQEMDAFRQAFLSLYLPIVEYYLQELLFLKNTFPGEAVSADITIPSPITFDYYPGWTRWVSFSETLDRQLSEDLRLGYTRFGPHRADLIIKLGHDTLAKERLSRGQQKMLVCALKLAQGKLLKTYLKRPCVYLVDDLQSELDVAARTRFLEQLRMQKTQSFVTGTDLTAFLSAIKPEDRTFHVEQGVFTEN